MYRGAVKSLPESQEHDQLTSDHDFTCQGFAYYSFLTSINNSIGALLAQKFCHYLLAHYLNLGKNSNPQVYVIPASYGKTYWSIVFVVEQVWYYRCCSQGALKLSFVLFVSSVPFWRVQAFSWRLALRGDLFNTTMHLTIDGSSTHQGGMVGVMLFASDGTDISLSLKLEFLYSTIKLSMKLWS